MTVQKIIEVPPSGLLAGWRPRPDPRARRGIRHRLATVIAAAVGAGVAGSRSSTALGEPVADLPEGSAARRGRDPGRRPSAALLRRRWPALDPDRLTGVVAGWLAEHRPPPATGTLPAIAVDGTTIRGSGAADTPGPACAGRRRPRHRRRAGQHRGGGHQQ